MDRADARSVTIDNRANATSSGHETSGHETPGPLSLPDHIAISRTSHGTALSVQRTCRVEASYVWGLDIMYYDDSMTVRAARRKYFADNGLGEDGGYGARWVRLEIGPLPLAFPNIAARKRAVPLHDLHHIATGYGTDLRGEAEIAAWELAAGCGRYWVAWVLDLLTIPIGLALAPRRMWRAWLRGRSSRSAYRHEGRDSLAEGTVAALRRELWLSR